MSTSTPGCIELEKFNTSNLETVKRHFIQLWASKPRSATFWQIARQYCETHPEQETYLAVWLFSQLRQHQPQLSPFSHPALLAWATAEDYLTHFSISPDRNRSATGPLERAV